MRVLIAVFVLSLSMGLNGETKIEFGSLIEQGMEDKKSLDKSLSGLMEKAEYDAETKEVIEFAQDELDALNAKTQQWVDSKEAQTNAEPLVY